MSNAYDIRVMQDLFSAMEGLVNTARNRTLNDESYLLLSRMRKSIKEWKQEHKCMVPPIPNGIPASINTLYSIKTDPNIQFFWTENAEALGICKYPIPIVVIYSKAYVPCTKHYLFRNKMRVYDYEIEFDDAHMQIFTESAKKFINLARRAGIEII